MRIYIRKEVFELLGQKIFLRLKDYISNRGVDVSGLSTTRIWNFEIENDSPSSKVDFTALKLMLNSDSVGSTYFRQKKFIDHEYDVFDGETLKIYLTFLECDDKNIQEQVKQFLKKYSEELSPEEIKEQKRILNFTLDTIVRHNEAREPNCEAWRQNLSNTFWNFYFYGYKDDKEEKNDNSWHLIRLILKFGNINQKSKDIKVEIKNTLNADHYSYLGKTDFQMSGEKVIIINLRTQEDNYRHLHIKLHVDSEAKGDFFMGQYLNYGLMNDQIWSGSVILERNKGKNPIPSVYEIDNGSCSEIDEIAHLVDFFTDKVMNFRRTTKQVHSRKEFEEWKKSRKNNTAQ